MKTHENANDLYCQVENICRRVTTKRENEVRLMPSLSLSY